MNYFTLTFLNTMVIIWTIPFTRNKTEFYQTHFICVFHVNARISSRNSRIQCRWFLCGSPTEVFHFLKG
jgi:hypothetical protein